MWNQRESDHLEVFEAFLKLARDPTSYRQAEQAIDEALGAKGPSRTEPIGELKAPYELGTRMRAEIRCLRVFNAL